MEQFELGLYDRDTVLSNIVLSNIVYDTFSLDTIVKEQPLQDRRPPKSNPEPELETSSESDAKSTREGTDDSAIELVSVSLPRMAIASSRDTAANNSRIIIRLKPTSTQNF